MRILIDTDSHNYQAIVKLLLDNNVEGVFTCITPANEGQQYTEGIPTNERVQTFKHGEHFFKLEALNVSRKEEIIAKIQRIIETFGSVTCAELELDASPTLENYHLIERFNNDSVTVVQYNENYGFQESEYDVHYSELIEELLEELLGIIEQYGLEQEKTLENIEN